MNMSPLFHNLNIKMKFLKEEFRNFKLQSDKNTKLRPVNVFLHWIKISQMSVGKIKNSEKDLT